MRMWLLPPAEMCSQHLLGEHVECHMLAGNLLLGRSVAGYIERGLVNVSMLVPRHDLLAAAMAGRAIIHGSPLPGEVYDLPIPEDPGTVDVERSRREIRERCPRCRVRGVAIANAEGEA